MPMRLLVVAGWTGLCFGDEHFRMVGGLVSAWETVERVLWSGGGAGQN
jgi:hypothetical protein